MWDSGFVIPIPWTPFRLRLFRWDIDASDKRVGITLQLEW